MSYGTEICPKCGGMVKVLTGSGGRCHNCGYYISDVRETPKEDEYEILGYFVHAENFESGGCVEKEFDTYEEAKAYAKELRGWADQIDIQPNKSRKKEV